MCYERDMSWKLPVAAVQMRSIGDLGTNLGVVRELVARAAGGGATLIVLPECFSFLGRAEGDKFAAFLESLPSCPVTSERADVVAFFGAEALTAA